MVIGVIANADKDKNFSCARKVTHWLVSQGVTPMLAQADADAAGLERYGVPRDVLYGDAAFIVVLGGDGTMLRAAHFASLYNTPLLGVNLGTLGYLTDVEAPEALSAIASVLQGKHRVEKRMMLEIDGGSAALGAQTLPPTGRLALNDICISRGGFSRLITIHVRVNGVPMDTLRADGLIIATPTGSTAYNLSAGGPIIKPDGEMMVITAVCPHAMHTRPWVIAAGDSVEICLIDAHADAAAVSLDGETGFTIQKQESFIVRKSAHTAAIIKTSPLDFYEILRRKMGCVADYYGEA